MPTPTQKDTVTTVAAPAPARAGGNPWFAATMGLLGLIVGYGVATAMNGGSVAIPSGGTNPTPTVAAGDSVPTPPPTTETPPDADDDPFIGSEDAPITLIEFTDYECPFCGRHFTQTFGQIKAEYVDTGKVKYVTRDYPLSFHRHAMKSAMAAECADDQGKFAEMHDKLFEAQGTWSASADPVATFKQYARDLGLDGGEFDTCMDTDAHKDEINKDFADGNASGVSGTPGFWILGPDGQNQLISGAYPYDTFKAAFDGMLQ